MDKFNGKIVIETLGTSEDEIFTKEYVYEDGICLHSQDSIDIRLEICRENEIQADQIGLKLLSEAGYSGKGLLKMLKKIRDKSWFGSKEIPSYFASGLLKVCLSFV